HPGGKAQRRVRDDDRNQNRQQHQAVVIGARHAARAPLMASPPAGGISAITAGCLKTLVASVIEYRTARRRVTIPVAGALPPEAKPLKSKESSRRCRCVHGTFPSLQLWQPDPRVAA